MKVGIITFHRAHNYGAVLQCYALQMYLKSMGYNVEVIDYYPSYFKAQYSSFSFDRFKNLSIKSQFAYLIKYILLFFIRQKRMKLFNKFIAHNLDLSSQQYNENIDEFKNYDVIFFGSDQIWNPSLTNGIDKVFSGNIKKGNVKFISYAASTNPNICNNQYEHYFRDIIANFDKISTREISLSNYLNNLKANTSIAVLDPVLLLNKDNWESIAKTPMVEDYLLIYTVPQSDKIWELAYMIAKKMKLKIIEIRPNVDLRFGNNILQSVSPLEFLGYFQKASFVVTTSFHGTAFSLKFQKQFVTLKLGSTVDDRAMNLLSSINLESRLIAADNLQIPKYEINYLEVNKKLNNQIKLSSDFIQSIFDEN